MSSLLRLTFPSPFSLLDFSEYTSYPPIPPPNIPSKLYTALLHPAVPITIALVYATTVHYFNSLSNGTPYRIAKTRLFKYGVILHNLGLAIYSLWTFIGMSAIVYTNLIRPNLQGRPDVGASGAGAVILGVVDSFCKIQDRLTGHASPAFSATTSSSSTYGSSYPGSNISSSGPHHITLDASSQLSAAFVRPGLWSSGLNYYGWFFYLSKFYEVVDTIIIILKGRQSSTLQTYHHAGAMLSMWAGIRWMSPPIWIFCWYNSGIHAIMYTYYTLSTLKIRVPVAVKRLITTMQITQFIFGGGTAAMHLLIKYRDLHSGENEDPEKEWVKCLSTVGEEWAVLINVAYLTPLTYLFVRFFIRSYISSGKKGVKKGVQMGAEKQKVKSG